MKNYCSLRYQVDTVLCAFSIGKKVFSCLRKGLNCEVAVGLGKILAWWKKLELKLEQNKLSQS